MQPTLPINRGWECPKCGRVYAPAMLYCTYCSREPTLPPHTGTPSPATGRGTADPSPLRWEVTSKEGEDEELY